MNILTLNYEYPPLGGGGGVASKQIAEGLVELGHDVDVLTSNGPELPASETINGVNIHRVNVGRKEHSTASLKSLLRYPLNGCTSGIQLCREFNYDCIHSHFAIPTGPLGVLLSKVFDIPHILSIHGGDIYDPSKDLSPHNHYPLQVVVSQVMKSADSIIAQSTDTRARAAEHYGIDGKEIEVIPLPYEPTEFDSVPATELDLSQDTTYLISIGRLVERKGYKYLLRALSQLDTDIELLLAGKGPEKESLVDLTARLDIEDRVHFLGYVDEEEKFQYLDVATLYVLSSLHEGFGIVVQEAMQTGLPIVATNKGGQTDIINLDTHGKLVPPEDTTELVAAIREILSEDLSGYRERNKKRVTDFETKRICRQYLSTFRTELR